MTAQPRTIFVMPKDGRAEFIQRLSQRLENLPVRKWAISIEPYAKHRSTSQNRLLWGGLYKDILALGGELLGGWRPEDLHEYLLGEWGGWETVEAFGRKRQRPLKRSSTLTTVEFSGFVEFICERMASHGIVLTLPGDFDGGSHEAS